MLWGGAFGFGWLYAAAAALTARAMPAPQGTLESVGSNLRFRTQQRPRTPAFFHWHFVVAGVHSHQRRFFRARPLESETLVELDLPRGRYAITAWWELSDLFGFTRLIPPTRWEAVHMVEPRPLPFQPPVPPASRPGLGKPLRKGRQAGDPFDVRAYTPGDDLRRLHWPLYAHAGVPFVRTAEPTPPPAGHQFIVLDTEAPTEGALDGRLGRLVTWLETLEAQGTGWTLAVPSAGLRLSAHAGPALAALSPAPFPGLAPDWPEAVTLLTGSENRGAELSRQLAASGRRYRAVVVEPDAPHHPARDWWAR